MNNSGKFWYGVLTMALMLPCGSAWAQWQLDSTHSQVNFVSIKNDKVGETHSFSSLVGYIGAKGNVQLAIDLDSVDTQIDVRNERMRELLFETANFPAAKLTAQIDPQVIAAAAEGGVLTLDVPATLELHGKSQQLTIALVVVGEGDGHLRVFSARPLLVNAADFDLLPGIAALQKIAGLQAISSAVPVTVQLLFVPAH